MNHMYAGGTCMHSLTIKAVLMSVNNVSGTRCIGIIQVLVGQHIRESDS